MHKRVMSIKFAGKFLSHSVEKKCTGTFKSFTDFDKRNILCIREVGHDFLSELICLTVPIKFIGEPFCVPDNFFGSKNFVGKLVGGSITVFCHKLFVAQCRKMFVGGILQSFISFRNRKKFALTGYVLNFCRSFCHTIAKNLVGEPFCVSEIFRF